MDHLLDKIEEDKTRDPAEITGKIIQFVHDSGLIDSLGSIEARTTFIDELTPEEFMTTLYNLNRTVRDLDPATHSLAKGDMKVSGGNAFLGSLDEYIAPRLEDRNGLFVDLLKTAQACDDIEQKARVIGRGINLIHAFSDGNGRLARAMYILLTEGYDPTDSSIEEKLKRAMAIDGDKQRDAKIAEAVHPLSNDRLYQVDNIRVAEAQHEGQITYYGILPTRTYGGFDADAMVDYNSESIRLSKDVPKATRANFAAMLATGQAFVPLIHWLDTRGELGKFTRVYEGPHAGPPAIVMDELLPTLSPEDIAELDEAFKQEPTNFVKAYFDYIVHPENHPNMKMRDGTSMSVRQWLLS